MRRWLIIRLVRAAARGWDADYTIYCKRDQGLVLRLRERWLWIHARRIERVVMPLARRLDPSNRWMGQEMVEHGWWG